MGFKTEDQAYEFAGTKTEQIKQIGNAEDEGLRRRDHSTRLAALIATRALDPHALRQRRGFGVNG